MKRNLLIAIIALITTFAATTTSANPWLIAWLIESDNAIVVTWKISNGKWKSCGPVQRLTLSKIEEREAIDRVSNEPIYFQGYHGEYKIYDTGREMKSYDYDARKCID